jgi:3-oxoacyl-[acyl-carrier protein] reductase
MASDTRRTILVTGAMGGIGRALVDAASREGNQVVLNYRGAASANDARRLASELSKRGGIVEALQADVSVAAEVERLVLGAIARFGQIDAVINNAGVGKSIPLAALDESTFNHTLHANLTSAFLVSQAAWPHMRERGGRLIFLSSGAARTGGGLSAAYAASKAGIEGLMHAYATALRPHRITANAIAPTLIDSDMADAIKRPADADLPLGRLGRTGEIWPTVRMILETEYLTGQTIHIDAGRYMT